MSSTAEHHLHRLRPATARAVVRRLVVCGCLTVALAPSVVRADGLLDTIREDVRTPAPAATMSESDYLETCDCDDEHPGDSASGHLVGWATLYGITSTSTAPNSTRC